ncbi:hypothetical protein HC028_15480 [Planosporangium flavigriseum]|uniref:Uncharacterized protein n=1 Tax=Planosporangium flavigriseum TaxID=373681 RepID=A0A8J3LQE2_9ACTN|nr:hypothetical protein [Planosporangium flavigriseum]NJC65892.1 hypothetical protein [Planosporangium flavigriseum]GIG75599.1 hypothetical protein Pfl04_40030 [Planosporangium flavigriseum]
MSSKNSTKIGTDNLVGDLSTDVAETRDALADSPQLPGAVRRHPAWWTSVGAGLVTAAVALGAVKWQQAHRTPKSRATRAWRGLTARFAR